MEVEMAADPEVRKAAKEFVDGALAARERLGYSAKVSKKSYGRAVEQATGVFERLRASTVQSSRNHSSAPTRSKRIAK
jgi:hypothetical protein